jgi:hypothetical protein
MEEKNFKAICTLLAARSVRVSILESIFLTHLGISCWFYTDSTGTLRKKNLVKSKVKSAQDLIAHLIEDNKAREQVDPSLSGKLCWLRNSSSRRLLESSHLENLDGRNASMIQVKLVQRYISNMYSNSATFVLTMKYMDNSYVSKLHRLVNKERTPFKHARIYSKSLLVTRLIIQNIEETYMERVISISAEFMLDRDGQLILLNTTDCKLLSPEVCLNLNIKNEADLVSLKSLIDRRSTTNPTLTKPSSDAVKTPKPSFKHGQIRNDDSFTGKSIPFKLDLNSIEATPEPQSVEQSPIHRLMKAETVDLQIPLNYTDNWAFKFKVYSEVPLQTERTARKKNIEVISRLSSMYLDPINPNFAEIMIKTFDKLKVQSPTSTSPDKAAGSIPQHAAEKIRRRYKYHNVDIAEMQPSTTSISEISAILPSKVKPQDSTRSLKLPTLQGTGSSLSNLLASYAAKANKHPRYLSPSYIRTQAAQTLSPRNQIKRYRSPYLARTSFD